MIQERKETRTRAVDGELIEVLTAISVVSKRLARKLTILADQSQHMEGGKADEQSLSASENQKWRVRKGFESGELVNWRFLFGYRISKEKIEIDTETAPIVCEIFKRVIAGDTFGVISRDLNGRGIPGVLGGKWCVQRIRDIICNEKYTGNALLQKHYRNNHLEKKKCRNTGELPMFYAEETHPAIIDEDTFNTAQAILQKIQSKQKNCPAPKHSEFTGKMYCPHCGKNYKRTTSNGTVGWNCSTYLSQGKAYCHGKKIPETTLQAVCASVLDTQDYSPVAFTDRIDRIEVPEDNHLRFIFKDGKIDERTWADRSRRDMRCFFGSERSTCTLSISRSASRSTVRRSMCFICSRVC